MIIHDKVYGPTEIDDALLIKLIRSQPVQRLKKINQAGVSQYVYPWKDVTRFEHSVGVMLLLRKFGASLQEQIAGLLHDVPHTAFSHVIDFVFENEHHEYHELFHEQIIANSEIANILKENELSLDVAKPEHYRLLERPLPDLCADRIDYALRDFYAWKGDRAGIEHKLSALTVFRGEFMFTSSDIAEIFASDYLEQDRSAWSDPRETALYVIFAQALRHALEKKILTHDDLFTDDETVLEILKQQGDVHIHKKLSYISPSFRIETATQLHHHLYVKTKTRFIDPKIVVEGKVKRLSELSKKFKKKLEDHKKRGETGWYIDIYKE